MSETTDRTGGAWRTNEDMINGVIKRLKTATLEISKSGGELYPILGMSDQVSVVYDTIPMLEGVIVYLEGLLNAE